MDEGGSKPTSGYEPNGFWRGVIARSKKIVGRDKVHRRHRKRLCFDKADFAVVYAIGDIHGCHSELLDAKRRIQEDARNYPGPALIVTLGDYVDRGKCSRDVIEHLSMQADNGIKQISICGNHDEAFLRFVENPELYSDWFGFAGRETLLSYGIDPPYIVKLGGITALARAMAQAIPNHHRTFLAELPTMVAIGDTVFVHAGIRPGVPLLEQSDSDLLWIREPFLSRGPELPLLVVHGHTPVERPFFGNGRIGLDTGAFATGRLSILRLRDEELAILT